jgi:hypothetical protein
MAESVCRDVLRQPRRRSRPADDPGEDRWLEPLLAEPAEHRVQVVRLEPELQLAELVGKLMRHGLAP